MLQKIDSKKYRTPDAGLRSVMKKLEALSESYDQQERLRAGNGSQKPEYLMDVGEENYPAIVTKAVTRFRCLKLQNSPTFRGIEEEKLMRAYRLLYSGEISVRYKGRVLQFSPWD